MGLIWTLSSFTFDAPIDHFPLRDKGVHFVEYGVLGMLLAHACFRTWPRHHRLRTAALAILITVLWGWLDEIHQAFVPGRSSDALDLVADTAGAITGTLTRAAIHFLHRPRTANR
ncbi:MAG: VanZ family protein [Sandaracinaceae bacterium]|nr:VanZ family protein [Sandaracinaceae bacterium]